MNIITFVIDTFNQVTKKEPDAETGEYPIVNIITGEEEGTEITAYPPTLPPAGANLAKVEVYDVGEDVPWDEGNTFDKPFVRFIGFSSIETMKTKLQFKVLKKNAKAEVKPEPTAEEPKA